VTWEEEKAEIRGRWPEGSLSWWAAEQGREIRDRQRWTQAELAMRIEHDLGVPIDRATIARIEGHGRGISLDDAAVLAVALNVSLVHLVTPRAVDATVALTPRVVVDGRAARQWIRGTTPLDGGDVRTYFSEVSDDEWPAVQHPGYRHLRQLVEWLGMAAAGGDIENQHEEIRLIRDELNRWQAELVARTGRMKEQEQP